VLQPASWSGRDPFDRMAVFVATEGTFREAEARRLYRITGETRFVHPIHKLADMVGKLGLEYFLILAPSTDRHVGMAMEAMLRAGRPIEWSDIHLLATPSKEEEEAATCGGCTVS
jgi:hypothetical protein